MRPVLLHIPLPAFLQAWGAPASVPVFTYGTLVLAGFLLVYGLAARAARREGVRPEAVQDIAFWSLLAGIAGARLMHAAIYHRHYGSALDILRIWQGGLVLYGAFLAVPPVVLLLARRHGLAMGTVLRLFVPPLPLGIAAGRVGCFLNGCCWGAPADLPWAAAYPAGSIRPDYAGGPLHPSQLYAAGLALLLAGLLLTLAHARPALDGRLLAWIFLAGYAAARLVEEHFRGDTPAFLPGGLTAGQGTSLLILPLAVAMIILHRRRPALPA